MTSTTLLCCFLSWILRKRGDSTADAEQVISNKWTPECLQERRIVPDSLDTDEEDDSEKEEENEPTRGKISTHPMNCFLTLNSQ